MTSRWLMAGALALAACTSPRQIVLSIDTTAGVPCDIDRIRVVATAAGTTTFEESLKDARHPVSITLLDDTPNGSFQLEISALKGEVEVMHARGQLQFAGHRDVEPVLLDSTCMPASPCALSHAMTATTVEPAAECGANVTRYSAGPGLDPNEEACTVPGAMRVAWGPTFKPVHLDSLTSDLAGAGFQFYGRPVRHVWVSKDGYLAFTKDSPDLAGVPEPGPFDRDIQHEGLPPPRQSVMPFWASLTLRATGVCYALLGSEGNRRLRVTWSNVCVLADCGPATGPDDLNFSVTLDEKSQRIAMTYGRMYSENQDLAHGFKATVGLVNDPTGCPSEECALATGLCKDGRTPCGYSQVFSNTRQEPNGVQSMQFLPIVDP